ncbi:uncharacterized protein [Triticum aestivum]|uniref:uncharacterized protein n=1 Tax=Triticum aestivum TaxID=4565 RepID=UPI001D009E3D|nr:uncharacterized protein LOC123079312 [Triticum aestivum]
MGAGVDQIGEIEGGEEETERNRSEERIEYKPPRRRRGRSGANRFAGRGGGVGPPGCGYFDSVAPIRPAKPPRSDPSDGGAGCAVVAAGGDLPELRKLCDLEAKPQKLVLDGGVANGEEYMEMQYYYGINCIDNQHHTFAKK